ncbi:MAG: DUF1501 domain-containing protein [Clostridia bacterium]|nr:DUF1501 domain-containing protein [Clostridia bacterium]MBQ4350119.1 DUF1501 domain-containing protein [Clostridia bacterium]
MVNSVERTAASGSPRGRTQIGPLGSASVSAGSSPSSGSSGAGAGTVSLPTGVMSKGRSGSASAGSSATGSSWAGSSVDGFSFSPSASEGFSTGVSSTGGTYQLYFDQPDSGVRSCSMTRCAAASSREAMAVR